MGFTQNNRETTETWIAIRFARDGGDDGGEREGEKESIDCGSLIWEGAPGDAISGRGGVQRSEALFQGRRSARIAADHASATSGSAVCYSSGLRVRCCQRVFRSWD